MHLLEDVVGGVLVATQAAQNFALYNGEPAVFYSEASHDLDENWADRQYPRCIYWINRTYSPDRTMSADLMVDIQCSNGSGVDPVDLAAGLVDEVSNMFISDGAETYAIIWKRTDQFSVAVDSEPKIIGATITFDVMAFPNQATAEPDPIQSVMEYIKGQFPSVCVIGLDVFPAAYCPTAAEPVCYVRTEGSATPVRPTYACVWIQCGVAVHVICDDVQARQTWIKRISERMTFNGEVVLSDGSPFLLETIKLTPSANPLTTGQMLIMGRYGVLREPEEATPLININIERRVI